MHTTIKCFGLLFLMASGSEAKAQTMGDFPMALSCQNTAGDALDIGMSPAKNIAYLSYKQHQKERALVMRISDPRGYNSGAWVEIKSESTTSGSNRLKISAQMNEVFRVTNYAQFAVELILSSDGVVKAQVLSYARGTDATTLPALEGNVDLQDMNCTLSGL